MPARLAGWLVRNVAGGLVPNEPDPHPESAPTRKGTQRKTAPKPLDDVTIARKVESIIFRHRKVVKGKIDVNVVDGVVWLRDPGRGGRLPGEKVVLEQRDIDAMPSTSSEVRSRRPPRATRHVPAAACHEGRDRADGRFRPLI
jgi:hypothetical protein